MQYLGAAYAVSAWENRMGKFGLLYASIIAEVRARRSWAAHRPVA
jgi:hypothetical protein